MGSLSASGIPVVEKTSTSYVKQSIDIIQSDSRNDGHTVLVDAPPVRAIGSGSLVRDDGSVEYYEERVYGIQKESRSSSARIPSATTSRDLEVPLVEGSGTVAVIEDSLSPHTPQLGVRHLGTNIVIGQAVGDVVVDRIVASGAFD
jgi:hypothetical protein